MVDVPYQTVKWLRSLSTLFRAIGDSIPEMRTPAQGFFFVMISAPLQIFQLGLLNKAILAELIKELSFIGRKIIQLAWSELRGISFSFRPKSEHFNSNSVSSSVIAI